MSRLSWSWKDVGRAIRDESTISQPPDLSLNLSYYPLLYSHCLVQKLTRSFSLLHAQANISAAVRHQRSLSKNKVVVLPQTYQAEFERK